MATAAAPVADDPIRPALHFTPRSNWINDPNGLVFYEGEWHLFYQYNPYGDRWGHMNWGHAVSRDLLHWTELGVAIPETEVMAFSGSAAIDWNNTSGLGRNGRPPMVAIWTGWTEATGHQAQYLSYSNDNGRTFTRFGTGPVLDIGSTEFRDPKVFWDAARKRWVMATVLANQNKVALYTSPDLKRWTKASEFGPAGKRSREWECPDLFPLPVEGGGTKWVMIVNISADGPAGGSAGQYFVGDFDGTRFTIDPSFGAEPQWLDRGADFYAGVTWNDTPAGRRVLIAWANDWRYARNIPTFPDRGAMSLPRELGLRRTPAGYRLVHAPAAELAQALPAHSRAAAIGEQ
ncbi:MAG: glycoside hydrolase family 32 protein, partial [Methylobacterium sp.]